jgi:hypothetical protein
MNSWARFMLLVIMVASFSMVCGSIANMTAKANKLPEEITEISYQGQNSAYCDVLEYNFDSFVKQMVVLEQFTSTDDIEASKYYLTYSLNQIVNRAYLNKCSSIIKQFE